ncbi:hypothetical protein Acr_00g0084450 [Actinidia rufa]|uniref:Retrovirus-related Pol polyprotein from transposon TNT 1-94-like beta-barrel domain-containing protein n=1 Tax=Actinidia rufa TaxID=165716 RepID=A0A7J0DVI8_9ERIC|nr:hypothetical protein Acr_00g0084450 [Actinidia rufa]
MESLEMEILSTLPRPRARRRQYFNSDQLMSILIVALASSVETAWRGSLDSFYLGQEGSEITLGILMRRWDFIGLMSGDVVRLVETKLQQQNRVGNRVRTHPHAPPEHRRVRLVSTTRLGRSHALPRARGRTHAPTRAQGEATRAATHLGDSSLAEQTAHSYTRASHAPVALLLLSSLLESWETLVVSLSNSAPNGKLTTSMVMNALFNEEAWRIEMGLTDQSESQALVSEGSKERGRSQGRGHHRGTRKGWRRSQARDTTATAVMAADEDEIDVLLAASEDGKSDWVLNSGSAYHLCRDREVFFTYAACEGRIWMANNTSSRVVGRGSVRFRMVDGRSVTLTETRSSGISKKSGQGKQPLHRGTQSKRRGTWRIRSGTRAQGDVLGYVWKSGQTRVVQPVQDVHRKVQRKETKSILRSCTAKGAVTPKRVSFALDLISGGDFSSLGGAVHLGEKVQAPQCGGAYTSSYGGVRSEAVKKDNLKTSDYPLVGWRGRLLSPAHLDESKRTWMSPSLVAKPKPGWSSYGVFM